MHQCSSYDTLSISLLDCAKEPCMSRSNTDSTKKKEQPPRPAHPPFEESTNRTTPANPEDFCKPHNPRRERMTREIKETPPEERIRKGR